MQLMQLYVQKSTSTTLPLRSASVIGSELMYPLTFVSSGASLNCDLSICTLVIVPLSSTIVAGTKLFCWPEAPLLSSGLLKYTPKPTIRALRLSVFIVLLSSSLQVNYLVCEWKVADYAQLICQNKDTKYDQYRTH